jgi:formiminotetrahydrofolate cyclodeaminase
VLESETVASLLERLADGSPAPGGGAAAALTAAAAAALLGMVSRVVARSASPPTTAEDADDLRRRALALMNEDAVAYRAFVDARHATRDRDAAVERALLRATETPLEIARVGGTILERCRALARSASGAVRSDLDVAAALARAARDAACITVRANVGTLRDRAAAGRIETAVAKLTSAP